MNHDSGYSRNRPEISKTPNIGPEISQMAPNRMHKNGLI